jgi:hypothetical protein
MTEKANTQPLSRPRFGSIVDRESSRLTQLLVDSHTQILRGLSLLAPKARRSRIRWIIAAGFLAVIGVLAADRPSREFLTGKGRDFYRAHTAVAATPAAPAAPVVAAAAPTVDTVTTTGAVSWPAVQVPAAVVASQAAEPPTPKEEAAPASAAAVQPTGARSNRGAKARGSSRPRTGAPQGGT